MFGLSSDQFDHLEQLANNNNMLIELLVRKIKGNLLLMSIDDTANMFGLSPDIISAINSYHYDDEDVFSNYNLVNDCND